MRIKHSALILTAGFLLIPTLTWSQGPGGGRPGGNWGGGQWGGDRGYGGKGGGGYSPVQYGQSGSDKPVVQFGGRPGGDKPVMQFGGPPGGMGGGGMGGGGRGMSRMDPDQLFNMLSGGKDVINVNEMNPMMKGMYDRMGPRLGLTGTTITRDQFKGAITKAREMAASGQAAMAAPAPSGGPVGFAPQMSFAPGGAGGYDPDRRAEDSFNRRDKNQNGVLEYDEMSETLQNERDKYDTNHDGVIDLNEYKAYMAARRSERAGPDGTRVGPNGAPADGDERKRPTIVRAGNMPKDFPYAALDRDLDGQIGLYEWKEAGRPIAEFLAMDLNNDGFLTVDEYFRWKQQQDEAIAKANGSESGQFGAGRGRGMNAAMMAMGAGRGMGPGGNAWPGGGMMNFPGGGMRGNGGGWGRTPGELPAGGMPGGDFGRGSRMRGGPGGDTGGGRGPGRMRGGDTGGGFGPPGGGFNPQDATGGGPRGFGGRSRGGPGGDTGAPGGFGGRNRGGPGSDSGDQGQGGGRGGRRGGGGGFGRSR